ncbi:hypothetical protein ABPG75_013137 [Micractinium tetrahymenae]
MNVFGAALAFLLLLSHGCSARLLLTGHPGPSPAPAPATVTSAARGQASGSESAAVAVGTVADGATHTTVSTGVTQAAGNKAATAVDVSGDSLTSSATVATRGAITGSQGASITSAGTALTAPQSSAALGFTSGRAYGASTFRASTATQGVSPFGTARSSSNTTASSGASLYGSAAALASSGPGGLFAEALSIVASGEGAYAASYGRGGVYGGYGPGAFSTTASASTTLQQAAGTAKSASKSTGPSTFDTALDRVVGGR